MATKQIRIFTNDNCTGCNRCIQACTVPQANIAMLENGQNKIIIDPDHCINCAKCIEACPHDARDYVDDTEAFIEDLAKGKDISILAAPAIRSNFPGDEYLRLLGLMRRMGARYLYDTSFGADICTWGYIRYIQKNNVHGLVSQPCPAVVNYIEKHDPDLISSLAPIHSPVMCAAIYMRKYKGIQGSIAFLSPCIAKKDEFDDQNTGSMIQYNVTFRKLVKALQKRGMDHRSAQPDHFDNDQHGLGAIYPRPGGLKKCVQNIIPDAWIHQVEGQPEVRNFLDEYQATLRARPDKPLLVDILNCAQGCNQGTGAICTSKQALDVDSAMHAARVEITSSSRSLVGKKRSVKGTTMEEFDKQLNLEDFYRRYSNKRVQPARVTAGQMENAYQSLQKDTAASRRINCCSCGFETCEEMARAVALGINHVENCVEYHKSVLKVQQAQVEQMLESREQSGHELKVNVERIFDALSENSKMSDETTERVTAINGEVMAMRDIAERLNTMVDVLNNQLKQYVTMGSQIVSISTMTKLLSMNASVEAAHARELGKGFAVVADQMKTLSDQSAASAREILDSNEQVFPMLEEVRSISQTLNERAGVITDSTREILESMQSISETEQNITEAASHILAEHANL